MPWYPRKGADEPAPEPRPEPEPVKRSRKKKEAPEEKAEEAPIDPYRQAITWEDTAALRGSG